MSVFSTFLGSLSFREGLGAWPTPVILGVEMECFGPTPLGAPPAAVLLDFLGPAELELALVLRLHSHSVKNTVSRGLFSPLQLYPGRHSVFSKMATPLSAVCVSALVFSVVVPTELVVFEP